MTRKRAVRLRRAWNAIRRDLRYREVTRAIARLERRAASGEAHWLAPYLIEGRLQLTLSDDGVLSLRKVFQP